MKITITIEDLIACWPFRDEYFVDILNGDSSIEDAREYLIGLIGSDHDSRGRSK